MSLAVKWKNHGKTFWLQTKKNQIPERKWAQDCPLQNTTNHTLCLETVDYKSSVLNGDGA